MSEVIQDIQQAVSELARNVELSNIRTVGFSAQLFEQAPVTVQEVHVDVDSQVQPGLLPEGFIIEGQFKVIARAASEDPKPHGFLELNYRVGAVYRLSSGELPSMDVLSAFAQTNGMIHLWPYVRAYVQQSCAQLATVAILLPPFRVGRQEASAPAGSTSAKHAAPANGHPGGGTE